MGGAQPGRGCCSGGIGNNFGDRGAAPRATMEEISLGVEKTFSTPNRAVFRAGVGRDSRICTLHAEKNVILSTSRQDHSGPFSRGLSCECRTLENCMGKDWYAGSRKTPWRRVVCDGSVWGPMGQGGCDFLEVGF